MNEVTQKPAYCVEYFYAKPEHCDELQAELIKIAEQTRLESGCQQYDLLQDKENHNLFIIIVKFNSQKNMAKHEAQPYVKAFADNLMDKLCTKVFWNDAIAVTD